MRVRDRAPFARSRRQSWWGLAREGWRIALVRRDPRWGRVVESAGEDVYLGRVVAAAAVRGFTQHVMCTAKHFAAYGAPRAGRDYNSVDISTRTLRDVYLPPFKAALDAGAASVMAAFPDLNGVPCHGNRLLLHDILRTEWGFEGLVVSDYNGVGELIEHGVAADEAAAGQLALHSGIDMDMEGAIFSGALLDKARAGGVPLEHIDEATRRVLRAKFALGLFDNPYVDEAQSEAVLRGPAPAARAAARRAAARSIVLLKNESATLPLAAGVERVAVVGPLAQAKADMLGPWCGQGNASEVTSILEGIESRARSASQQVTHARGCSIVASDDDDLAIAEAVQAAKGNDVVVAVVGESADMSGEAASRSTLGLPGRQVDLLKALKAVGKPLVVVLANGRPLTIPWVAENADAIVESWFLGNEAGGAVADVLYGDVNPGGKLPMSFPRNVGQVPIHYDSANTGRPPSTEKYSSKYLDVANTPLYPFGFGLSYTSFSYDNLTVTPPAGDSEPDGADHFTVRVAVTNTGEREGDEVVQVYVRDRTASVARPLAQLTAFQRVTLAPGQRQTLRFRIPCRDLGYHDGSGTWLLDPGLFDVRVAPSSDPGEGSTASLELTPEHVRALRRPR